MPRPDLGPLEALFVLPITLGLRPGELRALRWEHLLSSLAGGSRGLDWSPAIARNGRMRG